MATGGSIQLRLALAGSEEVKAALAALGPAGARALKEIEAAQQAPTVGMKALNAAGKEVEDRLGEMGGRAGAFGSVLTALGPAGLAAAAGIVAFVETATVGFEAVRKSVEDIAALQIKATKLGIPVEQLQELEYAAKESHVPVEALDAALGNLTNTIGKLQSGVGAQRLVKLAEELGIGPADLQGIQTAADLLPLIADRIKALPTFAEQYAAASKAGLVEILPLILQGGDGIRDLTEEYKRLHVEVSGPVAESMAEASKEMEHAHDIASNKLRNSLAELSGPVVALSIAWDNLSATVVDAVAKIAVAVQKMPELMGVLFPFLFGPAAVGSWSAKQLLGPGDPQRPAGAPIPGEHPISRPGSAGAPAATTAQLASQVEAAKKLEELKARLLDHDTHELDVEKQIAAIEAGLGSAIDPKEKAAMLAAAKAQDSRGGRAGAGRGPQGISGAQVSANTVAMGVKGDEDLNNAIKAELQARLVLTTDVVQRAALEKQITVAEDAAARDAQTKADAQAKAKLDEALASKTATTAEKQAAQAAYDGYMASEAFARSELQKAELSKQMLAFMKQQQTRAEEAAKVQEQEIQARIDMDTAQMAITTNMTERRKLAMQIFDLEEQLKELKLQEIIDNKTISDFERQQAQRQLDSLRATLPARRTGAANANADPLQVWRDQAVKDTGDVNTAFQKIAVDGLNQFNSALFDSQGRLNNLGSIAHSVLTKMLTDLEQYLIKQAEVGIFGGGSGGGGGGGGGLFSSIFSLFGGGGGGGASVPADLAGLFADGGFIPGSGGPRSDNVLAMVSPGEFVVNAAAAARWAPVLAAINENHPMPIPRFASGGMVGGRGTGDIAAMLSPTVTHISIDRSIHADGADSAALQRVADKQDEMMRTEPQRWAGYATAAKKTGFFRG